MQDSSCKPQPLKIKALFSFQTVRNANPVPPHHITSSTKTTVETIHGKWPTWCTIFFYVFISILYMFRATSCSSSGESTVSIQPLVWLV